MIELEKKALTFIFENLCEDGSLIEVDSYEDYFEVILILIDYEKYEYVKKILKYLLQFQKRSGEFNFPELLNDAGNYNSVFILNLISKYLSKIDSKEEIIFFIKYIKKSLNNLKFFFEEDYLLFYDFDIRKRKCFFAKENFIFLNFADEISDLLNEYDFIKEADEIFMLKGKIELGVQRYLIQGNQIVKFFEIHTLKYKLMNDIEILEISNIFNLNKYLINEILEKLKLIQKNFQNVSNRLLFYLILKNNQENYLNLLEEDYDFLLEIPNEIVSKDFYGSIEKSLFNKELKIIDVKSKTQKIVIKDFGRLVVASRILKLLLK